MKHCHFSILYNELPFLKAKLPFLYENFHQLIFFDLNIKTHTHSTDGSWEFLKAYPDPENKIVLIDQLDLSHITEYYGQSFVEKRKMFALGSKYVSDDMDVFWCDDMDEFFDVGWIKQVEEILETYPDVNTIVAPHHVFLKHGKWAFDSDYFQIPRISRHTPGKIYGHCGLDTPKVYYHPERVFFHYAFVGYPRIENKLKLYQNDRTEKWLSRYKKCETLEDVQELGHPDPKQKLPIIEYEGSHPRYLNIEKLCCELEGEKYYTPAPEPWMHKTIIELLDTLVTEDMSILEFGSGRSTLFLAQRCRNIVSVEHCKEWFDNISRTLKELELSDRVTYILKDIDYVSKPPIDDRLYDCDSLEELLGETLSSKKYDIIIVDGIHRVNCAKHSFPNLKKGGMFILDDSDRIDNPCSDGSYRPIVDLLEGNFYRQCRDASRHTDYWIMQ